MKRRREKKRKEVLQKINYIEEKKQNLQNLLIETQKIMYTIKNLELEEEITKLGIEKRLELRCIDGKEEKKKKEKKVKNKEIKDKIISNIKQLRITNYLIINTINTIQQYEINKTIMTEKCKKEIEQIEQYRYKQEIKKIQNDITEEMICLFKLKKQETQQEAIAIKLKREQESKKLSILIILCLKEIEKRKGLETIRQIVKYMIIPMTFTEISWKYIKKYIKIEALAENKAKLIDVDIKDIKEDNVKYNIYIELIKSQNNIKKDLNKIDYINATNNKINKEDTIQKIWQDSKNRYTVTQIIVWTLKNKYSEIEERIKQYKQTKYEIKLVEESTIKETRMKIMKDYFQYNLKNNY